MRPRLRALVACAVLAAALPAAADDFTVLSTVTSPRGGTRTLIQYLSPTRIRISDGDRDAIVDVPSGKVTLFSDRRREYWETSLDEVAAFVGQVDAALARSETMEQMRGPITVLKGSGRRKIAGYDTEQYTLTLGEAMRFDVWVAPGLQPSPSYFDARKVLYATMGPMGRRFDRMFDEMKRIKGFPLATSVDYRMRMSNRQTVTEATEVRMGAIPETVFATPAGYARADSPFVPRP
jgi:hypothetical protein